MARHLVTGATGLIGSQIAVQLREAGHEVVALVRPTTPSAGLEATGVQIVRGDLADESSLAAAVKRCDGVFHSAALVSSPTLTMEAAEAINVLGTLAVLDAARAAGVQRTVTIGTAAAFDGSVTLTERTAVVAATADPYAATKRGAFLAAMSRFDAGQDVVVVLPGATYGPCVDGPRSVESFGANQRLVRALRGEPVRHLPMRAPWSCTVDVAGVSIAAFERGTAGHRYLGLGAPDCAMTIAEFVNTAMECAGSPHRVGEVDPSELDDPAVTDSYPPTVVERARMVSPSPLFDASLTAAELGYSFVSVRDRLTDTVKWIIENKLL